MYTGKPPGRDIPENDYPTVITHNDGHKVLIVHSSAYTKYVGDLTVYFDDKGELIHWTGQPIYLSSDVPQGSCVFFLLFDLASITKHLF